MADGRYSTIASGRGGRRAPGKGACSNGVHRGSPMADRAIHWVIADWVTGAFLD
jgi:hypothetical protein